MAPSKESEYDFYPYMLRKFLDDISYHAPFRDLTDLLKNHVRRALESENIQEPYCTVLKYVEVGAHAAEMSYPDHPFDVQVLIATYITVFLYIDEAVAQNKCPELKDFGPMLLKGGIQSFQDPNLNHMARLLILEMPKHFGRYGTLAIVTSHLAWVNGGLFESRTCSNDFSFPPSSPRGPRFLRMKTGNSECFAHFLFPKVMFPEDVFLEKYFPVIPDLIDVMDFGNDILSFYKEVVVGNEGSSVVNASRAYGCSPRKVLQNACNDCKMAYERILVTLRNADENLSTIGKKFLDGYIYWHLREDRYGLERVFG